MIVDAVPALRRVFPLWRLFHSVAVSSLVFLFLIVNWSDFAVKIFERLTIADKNLEF